MKRLWWTVAVGLVILTIVIGYRWVTAVLNQANMTTTVQNLKDIALATADFHSRNGSYPTTIDDLQLHEHSLYDPATKREFMFHLPPVVQPGHVYLMVAQQPRPVRVSWLGEQRRYAAFVEGSVIDIEH